MKQIDTAPRLLPKILRWLNRKIVLGSYEFPIKSIFLIVIIFLFLAFALFYFLIAYQNNQSDPNIAIEKETKTLTSRIGRFMELPAGEQPNLATVTDREKLKGQDFFAHAENGDKLLIYPKAKKAILYRPSIGKIIEVTNLISGSQSAPVVPPESNP